MSLKDAFSGLKEELGKDFQSEDSSSEQEVKPNAAKASKSKTKTKKSAYTNITEVSPPQKAQRKVGKRSDPEFTQAPAFIRKTTHQQVKVKLIMDSEFNDYSELVEALLVQWLEQSK
ncbi:MAG: hypothetical protein AAFO76_03455 [Cyanobacteria bacterium J06607_15]